MASKTAIANAALGKIGGSTIGNIVEKSETALRVRNRWDSLRDGLLADHPWNFAIGRAQPAKLPTAPAFGFTAAYRKPVDCIRVWTVDSERKRWAVEGEEILFDGGSVCNVVYIKKIVDPEKWSAGFTEAFVASLAVELGGWAELSGAKLQVLQEQAQKALRAARSIDGQEGWIDYVPDRDSDWLRARW